jgi:hypothetical protein
MRCQSRAAPTSRSLDLGIPPGPCITYPQPHRTAAPKSHCGRSGPVFDPARQRRGVRVLLHRFGIVSHRTGRRSRSPVQRLGRVLRRLVPGDRLILVHPVADRRGAPQKVEVFGVLLGTRKRGAQTCLSANWSIKIHRTYFQSGSYRGPTPADRRSSRAFISPAVLRPGLVACGRFGSSQTRGRPR